MHIDIALATLLHAKRCSSQACRNGCLRIMDPPGACWEACQHPGAGRENFSNRCVHLPAMQLVQCRCLTSVIALQVGDCLAMLLAHAHRVCTPFQTGSSAAMSDTSSYLTASEMTSSSVQLFTFVFDRNRPLPRSMGHAVGVFGEARRTGAKRIGIPTLFYRILVYTFP